MNISHFKQRVKIAVENFWIKTYNEAEKFPLNYKELNLPLARIKRLMKVEEEVRMVASEVPILFSKITELFIQELTLRAWLNTEENKRRILQKNDLGAAVKTSDVYDFLIFIIPRNELEATFGDYEKFQDFETKYSSCLLNKMSHDNGNTSYPINQHSLNRHSILKDIFIDPSLNENFNSQPKFYSHFDSPNMNPQ